MLAIASVWSAFFLLGPANSAASDGVVFAIKPHHGQPALHINDRPVYPFMYLHHGGDAEKLHRQVATAGIHFHSFGCPNGSEHPDGFNPDAVDRTIELILKADPGGYLLPRVDITAPS